MINTLLHGTDEILTLLKIGNNALCVQPTD